LYHTTCAAIVADYNWLVYMNAGVWWVLWFLFPSHLDCAVHHPLLKMSAKKP